MKNELKIDQEFKEYIPPLSDDEYEQLEENLKNGFESERGKIIVWEGIIVDGHNRYEICKKYDIPFETHETKFKDRDAALLWIAKNQNGRRNIPVYARTKLELKIAEIELRQKAKENLSKGGQLRELLKQPFPISEKADLNKVETVDASPEIQQKDAMVIQKSESPLPQKNQHQEVEKKPPSADEEKPLSEATENNVISQKPEKQDLKEPDIVTPKPENLPLKTEEKPINITKREQYPGMPYTPQYKEKPINITKRVAEKTKTSVDTVSKVKYISEKADAETEKRLMKGDKDLSINKVFNTLKKAEKRKEILESFKEPELPKKKKKYSIIYADPPWAFKNYSDKGKGRSSENHYKCLSLKDIKNLPVEDLAADNCVLFIWVTFPFLEKGFEVIKAWGFQYKTVGYVWVKRNKKSDGWFWGLGYWTRSNAEVCLIATKGSITRQSSSVHQIIDTPVEGHSKKPDIVREKIVKLCGDIPRIELFARQKTDGWDVWGNEVELKIKRK